MGLDGKIKEILGEQSFALAQQAVLIEQLKARVAELEKANERVAQDLTSGP